MLTFAIYHRLTDVNQVLLRALARVDRRGAVVYANIGQIYHVVGSCMVGGVVCVRRGET